MEHRRHLTAAVLGGMAAVFVLLLAPIGAASAHSQLESSTPAAGSKLDTVPTEVTLMFNEEIAPEFSRVGVVDAEGLSMTQGKPATDGGVVTQALKAKILPGTYTVTFKVTSADGHPVSNAFTFIVNVGAVGSAPPTSRTSTSSRTSGSATSSQTSGSAAPRPSGTTTAAATPISTSGSASGESSGTRNLAIAAAVAALGATAWTVRQRRRR